MLSSYRSRSYQRSADWFLTWLPKTVRRLLLRADRTPFTLFRGGCICVKINWRHKWIVSCTVAVQNKGTFHHIVLEAAKSSLSGCSMMASKQLLHLLGVSLWMTKSNRMTQSQIQALVLLSFKLNHMFRVFIWNSLEVTGSWMNSLDAFSFWLLNSLLNYSWQNDAWILGHIQAAYISLLSSSLSLFRVITARDADWFNICA